MAGRTAAYAMAQGDSVTEPAPLGKNRDYFISYNHADREWAEWIGWVLEEAGYSVYLQAWDFRPGGNFVVDMQRAAIGTDRTIAVLSPDFLSAPFPEAEWAARFREDPAGVQGLLIPVRVRKCSPPGLLATITYIDLVDREESEAQHELLQGLDRRRAKPPARPSFPGPRRRTIPARPLYPGPVNVWLEHPTVPVEDWDNEANAWISINDAIGGAGFKALTIKAAYVVGTIHEMCSAVDYWLRVPPTNLPIVSPAYHTLCSAIELLGCCISDETSTDSNDGLRIGLLWLGSPEGRKITDQEPIVRTGTVAYAVSELVELRELAVRPQHVFGQGRSGAISLGDGERELLAVLRSKLAEGVDRWWKQLQASELLCNRLAQADVVTVQQRHALSKTWLLFERDASGAHHSITEILNRFDHGTHPRR